MWSLYNNALVKLNSDGYAQKSREVTGTIRSIMSSIPQNIRLGMFASDADPFPVRYTEKNENGGLLNLQKCI